MNGYHSSTPPASDRYPGQAVADWPAPQAGTPPHHAPTHQAPPSSSPDPNTSGSRAKLRLELVASVVGILAAIIPVAVIIHALASGQKPIHVETGGKITFTTPSAPASSGPPPSTSPVAPPAPASSTPAPSVSDISGTWTSAIGRSYDFQQHGTQVSIQELDPYGVVIAAGNGQIDGTSIRLNWQAVDGTTGLANLTLSAGGQYLQGTITSPYSGTTAFVLSR
jgi:hypothetical protein